MLFYILGQDGVYIFKVYEWEHEKPTGVHAYEFPTSGTLKKKKVYVVTVLKVSVTCVSVLCSP